MKNSLILNFLLIAGVSVLFMSCEKDDTSIIDPNYSAPVILSVSQAPDTVDASSTNPVINFPVTIQAQSENEIVSAFCDVFDSDNDLIVRINLSNTSGNNFSANASISNISCLLVGTYKLQFQVEDNLGLLSNIFLREFIVRNPNNQPPVITSTNLPDSVVRPVQDSVLLTISINATDPDGICDIRSATFDAERPDGIIFTGLPMIYEGNGLFKFSNYVTSAGLNGYFKYTFTVRDNSNASSLPVKDSIKFVQP